MTLSEAVVGAVAGAGLAGVGELEIARELVDSLRERAEEAVNASTTASAVVMNVRMVSGMMSEMTRGMAELESCVNVSERDAERAIEHSKGTAARVEQLTQAVKKIDRTAGLIRKIAMQSHILALNALIEAERAGAAGRGFAVVASEVKALSRETREATDEIDEELEGIRRANGELVGALKEVGSSFEKIHGSVSAVTNAVDQHQDTLRTITGFVQEAAESVEGIESILDRSATAAGAAVDRFTGFMEAKSIN